MKYDWNGMEKLSFEKVEILHKSGDLCGCMYLYSDNTEGYIEETYTWEEIIKHYKNGGGFGVEKERVLRR